MKKKHIILIILIAVAAVIVAAALIYTRPVTLAQMAMDVTWESCREIRLTAQEIQTDGVDIILHNLTIAPEDEGFDEVMDVLSTHTFRRSLLSLLPSSGVKTLEMNAANFSWQITAICEDFAIEIDDFWGTVTVSFRGKEWRVTPADKDAFLKAVFDLIKNNPGVTTSI